MSTTNTKEPAMTVTDKQIRQLRAEALSLSPSDHDTADLCNRALADDTVDQDGNAIAYADWTQDEARARVAQILANAPRAGGGVAMTRLTATIDQDHSTQWRWLVVDDLSPTRATVVAVYTSGAEAEQHVERRGSANAAMQPHHLADGPAPQIGDRIWR
jgi:hypothetical protein